MSAFELSIYAGKAAVVLIALVILYRLLGKRELAQMNAYDLATIVAVANAVQNAMTQGRGELLIGIVTSATLVLVAYFLGRAFLRIPVAERLFFGQPVLLISDGKLIVDCMKKECVSRDDLLLALRQHGLASFSEAAMAVLEIDGSISIVPKDEAAHIDPVL